LLPEGWTKQFCPLSDADTGPNVDSEGEPADEEADTQELANITHGEEPRTHKQAMASPDRSGEV